MKPSFDTENDSLWWVVLMFLVVLAVVGAISIDDVDGPRRPGETELMR